ncbi:MAG TPA: TlpA disulfide reductase family protein [Polyangiaceae bacterium]|nr:TlpA disulfide reductase family protein [Polyangiaceae bacterium]
MVGKKPSLIRVAVVVGLVMVACLVFIQPFQKPPRRVQMAAPAAAPPSPVRPSGLVGVDSTALFAHIRGTKAKGVVVNAWASWCASCKGDFPVLLGLEKTFGESIELAFVSVDEPETEPEAVEMLRGFGAKLPSFIATEPLESFKPAMNPKWPGMLPATFLFDRDAKLRYFWGGPVLETDLVPLLKRYLAGEHIDGEANFALAPGAVTR